MTVDDPKQTVGERGSDVVTRKSKDYWFPRNPRWIGPVRVNISCTREGLIFVAVWQAVLWSVIGLSHLLDVATDLRNSLAILILTVGFSVVSVKTEWSFFGE